MENEAIDGQKCILKQHIETLQMIKLYKIQRIIARIITHKNNSINSYGNSPYFSLSNACRLLWVIKLTTLPKFPSLS
jgi:hypothetical protein